MQKNVSFYKGLIIITSILEGFGVMAIELIGNKVIAPIYGTSLYVVTATLIVTLLGLAIGYFFGSILSAKNKDFDTVIKFMCFAAVYFFVIKIAFDNMLSVFFQFGIISGSVLALCFLMLPPLVLLGASSPLIIKTMNVYFDNAGKSSGFIYSISTVGGIVASIIVGYVLIPVIGVNKTILASSIVLVFPGVIYFSFRRHFVGAILIFVALSGGVIFQNVFSSIKNNANVKVIYKNEGVFGSVSVLDLKKEGVRYLMVNNTMQSIYHKSTGKAVWEYVHRIGKYASLKPKNANVLICGLGSGGLANDMYGQGFNVDVCELDQRICYVAKKYFALSDGVNVIVDDARHYINICKKKYDIIVFDLSFGETVPSNVYTSNCFNKTKNLLKENGFVFLHYLNYFDEDGSKAIYSIGNTIKATGLNCKLLNTTSNLKTSNELMYFACNGNFKLDKANYDKVPVFISQNFKIPEGDSTFNNSIVFNGKVNLLTDDLPSIDLLHESAALKYRAQGLTETNIQMLY